MSEPVIEFSETRSEIAKALFVMQNNLGDVKKNATNPHFKSKYADLGAVLDAVWPALEKAKLTLLQGAGGNEDGSTVIVETMLLHESGEFVRSRLTLKPSKADPQGAGSAVTYARRYSVQSLCGVAPEDDDGNMASRPSTPAAAPRQATPAPMNEPTKIPVDVRAKFNSVTSKLPPEEVATIVKEVQKHYGHEQTGNVADLYEGDEARDAYKFLDRKGKEFAA